MMGTLASEDAVGLGLSDSDLLTLLIRSLTEPCKSYVLHHSTGESYSAYRMAALRWEHRQRLFSELHHGKKLFGLNPDVDPGLEPFPNAGDDPYAIPEGPEDERWLMGLDGKGSGDTQRCSRCGKKAHSKVNCSVDLSRVKCFKCGAYGHISVNCPGKTPTQGTNPVKPAENAKGSKSGKTGNGKGDSKSRSKGDKGKGRPKGKGGKKGKMCAIYDEESDSWWYRDVSEEWDEENQEDYPEDAENPMVLSCLLPGFSSLDESSGCEVEPNTHKASWVMILSFLVPLFCNLSVTNWVKVFGCWTQVRRVL